MAESSDSDDTDAPDPFEQARAEQFRKRIGFDAPPELSEGGDVIAVWPDPATLPSLDGSGWTTKSICTWFQDGGAAKEWILARDRETLSVKVFVSSSGLEVAREYFLEEALAPTAEEVPFQKTADDEQSTTLVSEARPREDGLRNEHVLLLLRNVVLHLTAYDAFVDASDVAGELRRFAIEQADREITEQDRPPLERPELPPDPLRSGEVFEIRIPEVPDPLRSRDDGYEIDVDTEGPGVDFVGFGDGTARFQLRGPGPGTVRVRAVDRRTLLSSEIELSLEVVDAPGD